MFDEVRLAALALITPPLMYYDIRHRRLPNFWTYSYAVSGCVVVIATKAWSSLWLSVLISLILGTLALRSSAMGMGDVKLIAGLTLWSGVSGWDLVLRSLMWGFALAGLTGLGLLISRRLDCSGSLPMGPFLLLGAWGSQLGLLPGLGS